MKKLALGLVLAAGVASASGITLNPSVAYTFTDCAAAGSTAQTVTAGSYLLVVTTEDVWVCYAATCASGGVKLPSGLAMQIRMRDNTSVSCRSAASTGDVIFTRGE